MGAYVLHAIPDYWRIRSMMVKVSSMFESPLLITHVTSSTIQSPKVCETTLSRTKVPPKNVHACESSVVNDLKGKKQHKKRRRKRRIRHAGIARRMCQADMICKNVDASPPASIRSPRMKIMARERDAMRAAVKL